MSITLFLFYAAIIFWWGTELWIGFREKGKVVTGKDRFSRIFIIISVALGIYLGNTLRKSTTFLIPGTATEHFILGALLIFLGVSFRIWSVRTLGDFFRTTVMVQKKHVVVSNGPYTYLRHPSYSSILIAVFGAGLGIGNWFGLFVMFIFIFIGLMYRISVEEKVLQSELGKPYKDYMKHTKRLIPFVY